MPYYAILTHALDLGTPESWTEFVFEICPTLSSGLQWQGVAVQGRERLGATICLGTATPLLV